MQNFFSYYYEFTKTSEPPANFHAWTAIGVISALLGKKCFIPQGRFTVFPNLYIVLVGEPATRKSTAMDIGKKILRTIEQVKLAPESSTREALIDRMAANKVECTLFGKDISYWQASAFISEFEQFLGGKHVNQSMVGFLTDIWDIPLFEEHTRKGGTITIHNPFFSLVGCCTPSWMNTKLQSDVISDGFSRRTIFVLDKEKNCRNPWPVTSEFEETMRKALHTDVKRMFLLSGRFDFTKEARKYYDERYYQQDEEASKHSEKVRHYFSSKHILVLKISMCLSAAFRNDRIVDSTLLKLAFTFLDENEKRLDAVFSGVGRNELKPYLDLLVKTIEERRKMTESTILELFLGDLGKHEILGIIDEATTLGRIKLVGGVGSEVTYVALKAPEPVVVKNLLELASHTSPSLEETPQGSPPSTLVPALDPATEQLLATQKQRRDDSQTGVLLRGKPHTPSESPALPSLSALGCKELEIAESDQQSNPQTS